MFRVKIIKCFIFEMVKLRCATQTVQFHGQKEKTPHKTKPG